MVMVVAAAAAMAVTVVLTEKPNEWMDAIFYVYNIIIYLYMKIVNILTKFEVLLATPLMGFMPSLLLPDFSQFPIAAFRILTHSEQMPYSIPWL